MPDASDSRPRQATFAAWVIMVGSAFVVITAYQRISGLGSLETQEAIRDFLDRPPGDGLGLTFETARAILRYASLLTGACAAATGILGFHVLRRHRTARTALTALSAPLLIAGLSTGSFFPALVVAGVVSLWMRPASDWLAGRPQSTPGSSAGSGDGGAAPSMWHSAGDTDTAVETPEVGAPERPRERPTAITVACWVTWGMCGLVTALLLLTVVMVAAAPDAMVEVARTAQPGAFEDSGLSESQLIGYVLVAGGLGLAWCALAIMLAAGVYRGAAWGRVGLLVSAAGVGVLCVLLMVSNLLLFVPLVASSVTFGLLLRAESRAWCARRPDEP